MNRDDYIDEVDYIEDEYTEEMYEMIKTEMYNHKLCQSFNRSDLERLPNKTLKKLYWEMERMTPADFSKYFIDWTGILPSKDGAFYKASRPVDHGYFGWGMISMGEENTLLWIPNEHKEYHTNRLASGLIAIQQVEK